jgi:formylglycine-generating enzyme required for sulfatase activity
MSGNLQEWCWDWYDEGYYAMRVSLDNPKGLDSGTDRVRRGGSWNSNAAKCRCSFRTSFGPSVMVNVLGFRTVRR